MRKSIISMMAHFLVLSLIIGVSSISASAEIQASDYINSYSIGLSQGTSNGQLKLSYSIVGTGIMDTIGVSKIEVYKSSGTKYSTIQGTVANGLLEQNTFSAFGNYYFTVPTGYSYYCQVTFYSGKDGGYSSKYALTERLVCGCCGTPYRRCTWTSHGKKRIVWRCISRLDYGKKYCPDSPTIPEEALQHAIVNSLCNLATESETMNAIDTLKLHIETYFTGDNSIADDELRVKELVSQITQMAAKESYNEAMGKLITELNATKSRITLRRTIQQSTASARDRLSEVLEALEEVRNQPINYDDYIVRKLIECVRVLSTGSIEIEYLGGLKQVVAIQQ